jgi:hypothetical protein
MLAYSFALRAEREIVEAGRTPSAPGGALPPSKFKEEHARWMRSEAEVVKTIEAVVTPAPSSQPETPPPSPETGS